MSHGSYDSNLGSEILILAGDIRSRSWPNISGTYGTLSVKNSKKNYNSFFQYLIFIPKFGIFGINTEEYRKYWKNSENISAIFGKTKILDSFAENVVHLGIFGISGIIPKISVLLNLSIEIFSVFNSI